MSSFGIGSFTTPRATKLRLTAASMTGVSSSLCLLVSMATGLLLLGGGTTRASGSTSALADQQASGVLSVASWSVAAGTVYTATGDLHVVSEGDVLVAGHVLGAARVAGQGPLDGIDLRISSRTRIVVEGLVRAGEGGNAFAGESAASNCQLPSGAGGDVILEAPLIIIDGRVVAGNGGIAGANAAAARGGAVELRGLVRTTRTSTIGPLETLWERRATLRGEGGQGIFGGDGGGFAGEPFPMPQPFDGRGGAGGSIHTRDFDAQLVPFALAAELGGGWFVASDCADGAPGMSAATTAFGGAGSPGNPGQNGTVNSPQGGPGTPGGHGGHISGSNGGAGGNAPACCPLPEGAQRGGTGGAGGAGQTAIGGAGGAGGRGGAAYFDTATNSYVAPGGDGGDGGNGGNAASGNGGNGGAGGKPLGLGGAGGSAGAVVPGAAGAGGQPGRGAPNGSAGSVGAAGTGYPGADGAAGPNGAGC